MMKDLYIPVCKPPLFTLKVRIKKDQYHEGYSDIIKIDKGDNNITFTFLMCLLEPILKRFLKSGLMKERA